MTEIITIRLADNLRATADIFNLDNLATTLTIDYSGMGVDGWYKYVDFETSDGNKTRFDLGTESVVHLDLSNTVTTTGILKVNPLALLPVESSSRDIAQKTFKTYVFNVQETVNAYGYGSDNRNDMLIPMALDLTRLLDMHKVTPLAIDTDLNNVRERGTYGYLGTNVIANTPIAGSFVVEVYGLPIETGGIMQVYHNLDSPDSNIYRRFYLENTGVFSTWSDPKYDLEELREWTSEQIEQISGLSTEVVGDLLNLTQSFEDLQTLVTTQVNNRLTELEGDVSTLQTTVNNNNIAVNSQMGLLADDISAVEQRITNTETNLSQELGMLDSSITALENKTQFMSSPFDPSKISYTTLIEGTNLQNIKEPGFYRTNQSYMDMIHTPIPDSIDPFILEVQKYPNGSVLHTLRYIGTNQSTWTRFFNASTNQWDSSGWAESELMKIRGALPPGDANSTTYWSNLAPGYYQALGTEITNNKGAWGVVEIKRFSGELGRKLPTSIRWQTNVGNSASVWEGYYSDVSGDNVHWVETRGGTYIDLAYGGGTPVETNIPVPSNEAVYLVTAKVIRWGYGVSIKTAIVMAGQVNNLLTVNSAGLAQLDIGLGTAGANHSIKITVTSNEPVSGHGLAVSYIKLDFA